MGHDSPDTVSSEVRQIFGSSILEAVDGPQNDLQYFGDLTEWVLTLLLVGIKHALPGISTQDAIKVANSLAKTIYLPGKAHHWVYTSNLIDRHGMRAAVSRVMLELQRERMKDTT